MHHAVAMMRTAFSVSTDDAFPSTALNYMQEHVE
jgi:hypothetical protein